MALCGGIVLEEPLDLSFDRLLMMMMSWIVSKTVYIAGFNFMADYGCTYTVDEQQHFRTMFTPWVKMPVRFVYLFIGLV